MYYINRIFHPEIFQGKHKKKNYFEGWYYKMVHPTSDLSIAFIPGVSLTKNDSHAFIQVIYYQSHKEHPLKTKYIRFDINSFFYTENPFSVRIGDNSFSLNHIHLEIADDNFSIFGDIELKDTTKINSSFYSPNIMGFFAYIQFMECYHGVISMSHQLSGSLKVDNELIDFQDGKGYLEKDWGKSFPKEYVWMQSNHFENEDTSFMLSVARVPFLFFRFNGMIVNVVFNHREYRFASYNGSRIIFKEIKNSSAIFHIKKGRFLLKVTAKTDSSTLLIAPMNGEMSHTIKEGLSGKIAIELYERNQLIYQDTGTSSGIEIVNKLELK